MRFNLFLTTALSVVAWGENSPAQAMNVDGFDKKISSKQSAFSSPNESILAAELVSNNTPTSITISTSYDTQLSDLEELLENPSLKKVKVVQNGESNLGWVTLEGKKKIEGIDHKIMEKSLQALVDFKMTEGGTKPLIDFLESVQNIRESLQYFIDIQILEESLGHLLSEKVKANPKLKVAVEFKEVQHVGFGEENNFDYFKTVVDAYPSMSKFIWHFNIELWRPIWETESYYGDYPFPQKVMEYCLGKLPRLTHISLASWDFRKFSGVSNPHKIHFPALTSLELTSCRLDDKRLEILLKIFQVENIKTLDLSYNKLDTSFIEERLPQFKNLTSLKLMGMGQLEWGFLGKINIASPHLKKLSMGTFVALKNDLKSIALEQLASLSIDYDLGNGKKGFEEHKRRCAIDNHWLKSIFSGFTFDPQTEEFYRGISTRTLTFKRQENEIGRP